MDDSLLRIYEFGPFRIDARERVLLREGKTVPLTPKAFDTLLVLVESDGQVVDREVLMERVWPDSFVEEGNLKVTVFKLRKALGEAGGDGQYIETVPRRGYRFTATVQKIADLAGAALPAAPALIESAEAIPQVSDSLLMSERSNPATSSRLSWKVAGIAALVAGAALALWYYWSKPAPPRASMRSIAILPFKSLSEPDGDEYLGLGLADALITRLGNINQLTVRPTSAVRRYSAEEADPVAVGRELGVDCVVEAYFQKLGDKIRVTVQIIGVEDGKHLWAGRFDQEAGDLFAIEDRISQQLASSLALRLTGEEEEFLAKHYTNNTEAYRLYLKGRYFWNKRTEKDMRKGVEYFQQAIEHDPNYALAYSGLADSYSILGANYYSQAKAAALKALEIDDNLAEPFTSLAFLYMRYEWNWPEGERALKRALEINPSYATAHQWYSIYLELMGRPQEALVEAKRAQENDPLSPIINQSYGDRLLHARQYDMAIEQAQKTLEIDPSNADAHITLGLIYVEKGKYNQAINEYLEARRLNDDAYVAALIGHAYARMGDSLRAKEKLKELEQVGKREYVPPDFIARIYAGLGDAERALELLRKALAERTSQFVFIKVDPAWDGLRRDPRFAELLAGAGL